MRILVSCTRLQCEGQRILAVQCAFESPVHNWVWSVRVSWLSSERLSLLYTSAVWSVRVSWLSNELLSLLYTSAVWSVRVSWLSSTNCRQLTLHLACFYHTRSWTVFNLVALGTSYCHQLCSFCSTFVPAVISCVHSLYQLSSIVFNLVTLCTNRRRLPVYRFKKKKKSLTILSIRQGNSETLMCDK